jgi:hypothetical protein
LDWKITKQLFIGHHSNSKSPPQSNHADLNRATSIPNIHKF